MIMDKWVEKNLGKGIDYDGVYGVQCVDLIKHFVKNVLLVEPQSIGNAIEYYRKRKTSSYLKTNFKWISNSAKFVPQKGDLEKRKRSYFRRHRRGNNLLFLFV